MFVCSDLGDVMLANSMESAGFDVDVLYLGRDLPGDRSALSRVSYLAKYDEVWIPDLNVNWTQGGRLTRKELEALSKYVERGGVLVVGLNTFTQSWSRDLEDLTGARLMSLKSLDDCSGFWDIIYRGEEYTLKCGERVAVVRVDGGEVVAYYKNGYPAIVASRSGGVAVLITFNPVTASQGNRSIVELLSRVALDSINERSRPPYPASWLESLILRIDDASHSPLFQITLILVIAGLAGYLGFAPLGVVMLLAIPLLPLARLLQKRPTFRRILETVSYFKSIEESRLADELGVAARRLKLPLALLVLTGKVGLVDLKPLGGEGRLVVVKNGVADGVALWSLRAHPRLINAVVENPGVTVVELARITGMPPLDVLRIVRSLSMYGVVEVRKIDVHYEVYPTRSLLMWVGGRG